MPKHVEKKSRQPYFGQMWVGDKPFDVRLNRLDPGDVKSVECPKCGGDGWVNGDYCESGRYNHVDCSACEGKGQVPYAGQVDLKYEVGDVVRFREWVQVNRGTTFSKDGDPGFYETFEWDYTGRAIIAKVASIAIITASDSRLFECPSVFIDGNEFWKPERVAMDGLAVLGLKIVRNEVR